MSSNLSPSISNAARQPNKNVAAKVPRLSLAAIEFPRLIQPMLLETLSDDEARATFQRLLWSDNGGEAYCPQCGCLPLIRLVSIRIDGAHDGPTIPVMLLAVPPRLPPPFPGGRRHRRRDHRALVRPGPYGTGPFLSTGLGGNLRRTFPGSPTKSWGSSYRFVRFPFSIPDFGSAAGE